MPLAQAVRRMNDARRRLDARPGPQAASVFISYAHPDRPLVEGLSRGLGAGGFEPWWDDRIEPGDVFEERIVAALDAALAVVVVWSPHSVASRWVKWEAHRALRQGKLMPLAVPDLDLRDIRPPFNGLNTLRIGEEERLLGAIARAATR